MTHTLATLLLAAVFQPGAGDLPAGIDDFPALEGAVEMLRGDLPAVTTEARFHEVLRDRAEPAAPARAPFEPPAPVPERPSGDPPSPDAVWIGGYWDWDEARQEFGWISGVWRVPPPGKTWVAGRWVREGQSWTRVPGSWSGGHDWRAEGPPADHPAQAIGPAPSPGHFFVPGHYVPDGDDLAWRQGFWAKAQPGWEWNPAHWVRRADGWAFFEGRWVRAAAAPGRTAAANGGRPASDLPATAPGATDLLPVEGLRVPDPTTRHVVARPAATGTRPSGDTASDPSLPPEAAGLPPRYPLHSPGAVPARGPWPPAGPGGRPNDPNRGGEPGGVRRRGGSPIPLPPFLRGLVRPNRR